MNRTLISAALFSAACLTAQQQSMPGMDMEHHPQTMQTPAPGTDTNSTPQSRTHPTGNVQEPENEELHTGGHLPAPELLNEAIGRKPMSIEEFLSLADSRNPTVAQARTDVTRAQQQARQAALPPNPTVGYSAEHIRGGEYGGGEQGAYIQQEFVLGGKLGLRRNTYQAQTRSNEVAVSEQTYRVHASVLQAFYSALASQARVIVRQRLLGLALDAVETAHQLSNVGQADAPDVLQAEVEAEQAKVDFVHAQREYIERFHQLAAVAGMQDLTIAPLQGDIEHPPEIDADQQVATILSQSPTLKRAQQDVAVAEARLKQEKREPIPNLTVRAGEWYSGEVIESSQKPAGPMSFVDASVQLPLWNRNQGSVGVAKAALERAREEVTRTELLLKHHAQPLAQRYLSSQFEAERYRTQLIPRSKRAYELYLMKYQQMAAAYPQVLVSQRTLFQLQIDYLRALEQEWINAVALQNYTLTGGLQSPLQSSTDNNMTP